MVEKIEYKEESSSEEKKQKCPICGEEHKKDMMYEFEIKGERKYICKRCADTIHGLV